jgi:hypothetical protein
MRKAILALFVFIAASVAAVPCSATPDGNAVLQLKSIGDLASNPLTNYSAAYVGAYYCTGNPCPADGGQGYFLRKPGACSTVDGGRTIQDMESPTPACWYRQNLNGDLRQWGITTGSVYDAANTPVGSLAAADSLINNNAIPAFRAAGIRTIHTGQVSILLHGTVRLDAGWSLTCDTPRVITPNAVDFSALPGSIVLGHTAFLDAAFNDDVEIHDCAAIIPEWYKNPSPTIALTFGGYARDDAGPVKYTELEAIRANMVLASDTAITAGTGASIHDLSILGFDNCVNLSNGPGFIAKNLSLDCDIGLYIAHENGISTVKDVFNIDYLTKGTASLAMPFPNEEYGTDVGALFLPERGHGAVRQRCGVADTRGHREHHSPDGSHRSHRLQVHDGERGHVAGRRHGPCGLERQHFGHPHHGLDREPRARHDGDKLRRGLSDRYGHGGGHRAALHRAGPE